MEIYYGIVFFIFGLMFGSFFNVVGYRLPKGESLMYPSSHCPNCNHKLNWYELIPVFSYLFLGCKCLKCKKKISPFYMIFELLTGILFLLSYFIFGFSIKTIIALTLSSILIITMISDFLFYIIEDKVLIVGAILLIVELFFYHGFNDNSMFDALKALKETGINILNGIIMFGIMYLIKLMGDFLFKKESMGGGDIKLMFIFGLTLGIINSIVSIFLASVIALPIAIIFMKLKSTHEIPFGPFLSIAALILFFSEIDIIKLLTF